jgi:type I restriction enzyme S subunit
MYPGSHDPRGTPLIKVSDVKNGAVTGKPEFCVSEEVDHEYRRTRLSGNELLITLVGNPGDCAIVDESMEGWNAARALAVVRLKDPDLRPWLRYVLLSSPAKHLIDARLNTTVQKTLNLKDIKSLPIPVAPKGERESIVRVASALESKVNLNHQINQTLEQMAQAIFKSWFVDFEPVKAKIATLEAGGTEADALLAAMQVISGKDADQLNQMRAEQPEQHAELRATAELFPSAMQDSELGEIPEGWEVVPLKQLCKSVQNGATPKRSISSYWADGDINWFKTGELTDSVLLSSDEKITGEGLAKSSCKLWPRGTVLIAIYAAPTVGRLGILTEDSCSNQACSGLIPSDSIGPYFIFNTLMASRQWLNTVAVGAAQQNISKAVVENVPALTPPTLDLLRFFNKTVIPLWKAVESRTKESAALSELRDTLLPKLLSGELTLPNTEESKTECQDVAHV